MDYISLIIGAIMGFALGQGAEWINRNCWDKFTRTRKAKRLYEGIKKEIDIGIERCDSLIRTSMESGNQAKSKGRVYTAFWDSVKAELIPNEKYIDSFNVAYEIYYRFHQIASSAEREDYAAATGFAESTIIGIKENSKKLSTLLEKL